MVNDSIFTKQWDSNLTMNLYPYLRLFAACLLISLPLTAMPIPDLVHYQSAVLSLPELLDMALTNNPETRVAWWNARRAAASRAFVATDYYPKLFLHGSAIHGRDYKFPNGQQTTYTSLDGDIILSYLLYDFGERNAKNEAAKAALHAVNWQSDWTVQKVMYNVITHTYTYLNAQEQLQSRLASLRDAQETLKAAEELQRAGLRSITDVYAIKANVSALQMGIALQKAETDVARGKLAASLGIGVDEELNVMTLPDPVPDAVAVQRLDALICEANQTRADLLAKRSELQQKHANIDKVAAQYQPKVNFKGTTGYKRYIHDRTNGSHYKFILNFDMPLYDGFESMYQNRIAYSEAQATEAEIERLELEIALEILTYSRMFEAAQEILSLSQQNLENSFKTFDGTLEKYKAGTQSIFDLTAAQDKLAEARLKHGEAKTRWYRTLAQLAYSTGTIAQFTEGSCATTE